MSTPTFQPNMTSPPPLKQAIPAAFFATMAGALGTMAAITWSDAFRSLFEKKGIFAKYASHGPWFVAILATFLAVFGIQTLYTLSEDTKKLQSSGKDG